MQGLELDGPCHRLAKEHGWKLAPANVVCAWLSLRESRIQALRDRASGFRSECVCCNFRVVLMITANMPMASMLVMAMRIVLVDIVFTAAES